MERSKKRKTYHDFPTNNNNNKNKRKLVSIDCVLTDDDGQAIREELDELRDSIKFLRSIIESQAETIKYLSIALEELRNYQHQSPNHSEWRDSTPSYIN